MSFLRINGRAISVASLDEAEPEVGSRNRAVDGTLLVDSIGHVREWEGKTPRLTPTEIAVVRKLLRGEGQMWPYDVDFYSSKGSALDGAAVGGDVEGNAADGSIVATSSPFPPVVGGSGVGAVFGSAYSSRVSTNLFPQNVRDGTEDTTTTGFTLLAGGSIFSNTAPAWQGDRSLNFLSGGAANDGFETAAVGVSSSTIYVGSVYLFLGSTLFQARVQLIGDVSGVLGTVNTTIEGSWLRLKIAVTTGGSDTTLKLRVTDTSGVLNGFIAADGFQLEADATPTAWVDGVRASSDQIRYPIAAIASLLRGDFTVAMWFKVDDNALDGTPVQALFTARDAAADNGIDIEVSGLNVVVRINEGGSSFTSTGSAVHTPGNWAQAVAVVRRSPGAGESNLTLYFGGSQVDADDGALFDPDDLDRVFVGSYGGGSQANGTVDDLVIVPYAMSAAQISAIFGAQTQAAPLPKVHVDGDFIEDDPWTVLALGEVGKAKYGVGGGANNLRELRFGLVTESLET